MNIYICIQSRNTWEIHSNHISPVNLANGCFWKKNIQYTYKSYKYPAQLEGIPPWSLPLDKSRCLNSPLWEFINAWSGKKKQSNDSSGIRVITSITECTWYAHEHSKQGHKIRLESTSKGITSKNWLQKKHPLLKHHFRWPRLRLLYIA